MAFTHLLSKHRLIHEASDSRIQTVEHLSSSTSFVNETTVYINFQEGAAASRELPK